MAGNKSVVIVRNDENNEYDRSILSDYLARIAKEKNKLLMRELKGDKENRIEIIETSGLKKSEVDNLLSEGWAKLNWE